jgi:hypothetical protein
MAIPAGKAIKPERQPTCRDEKTRGKRQLPFATGPFVVPLDAYLNMFFLFPASI